jgi:hypothetical protein
MVVQIWAAMCVFFTYQKNIPMFNRLLFFSALLYGQHVFGQSPCVSTPHFVAKQDSLTYNDTTLNSPQWYVDITLLDPVHQSLDLSEGQPELQITAADTCSGANISIQYLLFLDTDGDGAPETVVNSDAPPSPGFLQVGNAPNPGYTGGVKGKIDLRELSMPIGTPLEEHRYRFALQTLVANGEVTAKVAFNTIANPNDYITAILPHGSHKIRWVIKNGAGVETTHEHTFTIRDGKAPIVVCAPLSVNLQSFNNHVSVWDVELMQYQEDNCTPVAQLESAICRSCSSFPEDTLVGGQTINSVMFTCPDLGTQEVIVWSRDKSNPRNVAFCKTNVTVYDGNACCLTGSLGDISGKIVHTDTLGKEKFIENAYVQVTAQSALPLAPIDYLVPTSSNGRYQILNLATFPKRLFTITPFREWDYKKGVDMLDALLVQDHILANKQIQNPYLQIAADVNSSGTITLGDVNLIRKLILGGILEFPNTASTRFVPTSFTFPNPSNAFQTAFPESYSDSLTVLDMVADFEMLKVGDVNASAFSWLLGPLDDRSNSPLDIQIGNQLVASGEEVTAHFQIPKPLDAIQLTLQLADLEPLSTTLPDGHFMAHEGALTIATDAVAEFSMTFRAGRSGNLSEMLEITDAVTKSVAFSGEKAYKPSLSFVGTEAAHALYPNTPNPFSQATEVRFYLPKAEKVTLNVYDGLGRLIHTESGVYAAGKQSIRLQNLENSVSGVLTYTLKTDDWTATGQMVKQ